MLQEAKRIVRDYEEYVRDIRPHWRPPVKPTSVQLAEKLIEACALLADGRCRRGLLDLRATNRFFDTLELQRKPGAELVGQQDLDVERWEAEGGKV